MFFKKFLILFVVLGLLPIFSFSQAREEERAKADDALIIQDITEENLQFFLNKSPFVVLYFYSPRHAESLNMKKILQSTTIEQNPLIYSIQIDTNLGLRQTFKVSELPAIVVLKNRKLLYGLSGYIDDPAVLSDFINQGIQFSDAP